MDGLFETDIMLKHYYSCYHVCIKMFLAMLSIRDVLLNLRL